jgi:hypothetical protein
MLIELRICELMANLIRIYSEESLDLRIHSESKIFKASKLAECDVVIAQANSKNLQLNQPNYCV